MRSIPQQVMNALQTLSPIEQQEVLDFVEFLQNKQRKQSLSQPEQESVISALDLVGDLVGSLEGGTPDLSTNKKYLEGFGQE
jgi:hypothetical protein